MGGGANTGQEGEEYLKHQVFGAKDHDVKSDGRVSGHTHVG